MKKLSNDQEFKDYNVGRGVQTNGCPSVWVGKAIFKGMTEDKFIGRFKIPNYKHGNDSRETSKVLEDKASKLPCDLVIHMANANKTKVSATVTLIDYGMFDDGRIGIVISGVKK